MATARLCVPCLLSETVVVAVSAVGRLAAAITMAAAVVIACPPGAVAAEDGELAWTATIDGRRVDRIDGSSPLPLGAEQPTTVELNLTNNDEEPLVVSSLRLQGRVLGMAFFTYAVRMDLEIAAGDSVERRVDLYLDDVTDQAVGLIPTEFELLDANREIIADEDFPVDVHGSLWSTYGWFGLAVAASTCLLIAALLLAIARTGKPGKIGLADNRWIRAIQFAVPGLGVGLTLTFTLSATGLLVPSIAGWLPAVAICAGAAFVLGYFLPIGRLWAGDDNPSGSDTVPTAAEGAGR
jgi:hypothetical protein